MSDEVPESAQKVIDREAARTATLWVGFMAFLAFVTLTLAGLSHEKILSEAHLQLPLLNVDLSVPSFSLLAPLVLIGFHIYTVLQFRILNDLILVNSNVIASSIKEYRTDNALFLQTVGGVGLIDPKYLGKMAHGIPFFTLALLPLAALLYFQFVMLPYHVAWVTNLQRLYVVFDAAFVIAAWPVRRRFWGVLPVAVSGLAVFLALSASFPGEFLHDRFHNKLTTWLFEGSFDRSRETTASLFTNTIVIVNRKKLLEISLRDRDLRGAIFDGTDLTGFDFSGSNLTGASFRKATLTGARFDCLDETATRNCADLRGADFFGAEMSGSHLDHAIGVGTLFETANLQKASLWDTNLTAASLRQAHLEGADLSGADLTAASLTGAHIDKTQFDQANLSGTSVIAVDLTRPDVGTPFNQSLAFTTQDDNAPTAEKQKSLLVVYERLACTVGETSPYAARGLIRNRNLTHLGDSGAALIGKLTDPVAKSCPGAVGLGSADIGALAAQQ